MGKKEYISFEMDVILLEDARIMLTVSVETSGNEGEGIPDWD